MLDFTTPVFLLLFTVILAGNHSLDFSYPRIRTQVLVSCVSLPVSLLGFCFFLVLEGKFDASGA